MDDNTRRRLIHLTHSSRRVLASIFSSLAPPVDVRVRIVYQISKVMIEVNQVPWALVL